MMNGALEQSPGGTPGYLTQHPINMSGYGVSMATSEAEGLQVGNSEDSVWAQMSLDDLRIAIQRLLKENSDLKHTMLENNAAMEEQCELLEEWQTRTDQERANIVEKFNQAKTLVETLKQQKADVEAKLKFGEVLPNTSASVAGAIHAEVAGLKLQVDELRRENKLLTDNKTLVEATAKELEEKLNVVKQHQATTAEMANVMPAIQSVEQVPGIMSLCEQQREMDNVFKNYQEKLEQVNKDIDVRSLLQLTSEFNKTSKKLDEVKLQIMEDCQRLMEENIQLKSITQEKDLEIQKLKYTNEMIQKEKLNLTAMNNDLQTQVHLLQRTSPSKDESTSLVLFDATKDKTGTPNGDFNMNSLPEGYVNVMKEEKLQKGGDVAQAEVKKKHRQQQLEKTMSELLIQLTEEREKFTTTQTKLNDKTAENEQLKKAVGSKDYLITDLQKRLSNTVEQITLEHQLKLNQLVSQMDSMSRELQHAKGQQAQANEFQHLKSQVISLFNELQEAEKRCEDKGASLKAEKDRSSVLVNKLSCVQEEMDAQRKKDNHLIRDLQGVVQNMEANLEAERQEKERHRMGLVEMRTNYDRMYAEYHELLDSTDRYKDTWKKQGVPVGKELTEKLDNLTAQLFAAEEALGSRNEKIFKLEVASQKLKEEAENVPILKAQAEVYKTDFEAERRNREEAMGTANQLKEEILHLQRQNQQLRDELETSNHQQIIEMQRRHAASYRPELAQRFPDMYQDQSYAAQMGRLETFDDPASDRLVPRMAPRQPVGNVYSQTTAGRQPTEQGDTAREQGVRHPERETSQDTDNTEAEDFVCPSCNKQHPDLDSLQLHINRCLELDHSK